jgi:hypothetical protein
MIPRKCSVLLRAAKRSVPVRRSIAGQRQQYSSVGARGPLPTIEQLFSPTPEITEQEGNVLSLTMTQVRTDFPVPKRLLLLRFLTN